MNRSIIIIFILFYCIFIFNHTKSPEEVVRTAPSPTMFYRDDTESNLKQRTTTKLKLF